MGPPGGSLARCGEIPESVSSGRGSKSRDAGEGPIPVLEANDCTLLSGGLQHQREEISFEAVFISRLIPGRLAHDWRKKLADLGYQGIHDRTPRSRSPSSLPNV